MGNIIESSVESFPSTQELSQGNDSLEVDSLNAEPSDAVETQSTRELSPPPGQRRRSSSGPDGPTSRPLSRVLIHGEDSSNIWIPCPDATIAQTTAGPETNAFSLESPNASSLESPNDSLSLSESNIPTTFDTSFDNAEMSHLFAHPGNVEVEVAERPTCMLAVDTKDVLPREPLSMAAEFSHLESTMLELLSSPVPFYPAVMGEMLERSPTEPTEPPPDVRIFNSPNPVDPTNAITNSRSSSPGLPEIIPLVVTTYADATNLAMQYPELAEEILALPLPTPPERVIERDAITEEPRPLSPSLHHPDKPHWAAAPLPDVSEPTSAPVVPQNRGDKNTADSRFRRQRDTKGCDDYGSSVRSAHHDASGSRPPPQVKKAKRRHKPVPHHKGTDHPDLPPHLGISLQRRSSDPPHPCNIAPEIADDDTGTISSPTRNWDCGHTQTAARNAPLMASSCGRPDVDADHKVRDEF
ncbi:hypothetical protein D9615_000617 [Tricholomella constricta]|uniref:Uncharacterized protein n=1 Tax=Tricholomella constricta TaxID=117010 RepID=A0A8H5HR72_9AGAR|nr:hypothetical protein D9615_000617 [Tricholomella constricta]